MNASDTIVAEDILSFDTDDESDLQYILATNYNTTIIYTYY